MGVLALFALLTDTRLMIGAQHRFRVLALFQRLLLNSRDRLEQSGEQRLLLQLFLLLFLLLEFLSDSLLLATPLVDTGDLVFHLVHKPMCESIKEFSILTM